MDEPPENPQNLYEWLWRLKHNEKGIFVREQIDGVWDAGALSDLPPDKWAYHVSRWICEGILPARVRKVDNSLPRLQADPEIVNIGEITK